MAHPREANNAKCETANESFNQIDYLKSRIERLDRIIQDQQTELLVLYRRIYERDRPIPD